MSINNNAPIHLFPMSKIICISDFESRMGKKITNHHGDKSSSGFHPYIAVIPDSHHSQSLPIIMKYFYHLFLILTKYQLLS